jgi:hypothetical protein
MRFYAGLLGRDLKRFDAAFKETYVTASSAAIVYLKFSEPRWP